MGKTFKYGGEEFEVSEPKNCRIEVTGKGYTGEITIHEATGTYRESVLGWGTDQPTLERALTNVCARILERASKPTKEDLCKPMEPFYKNLDG